MENSWDNQPTNPPVLSKEQKAQRVIEAFSLKENKLLKADPIQLQSAITLLTEHYDCFSWNQEYGETHLIQHEIHLEPGTRPINCRYCPPNPALEKNLEQQIEKWLNLDVLEPSNSPWNFGLVAVPKRMEKSVGVLTITPLTR